MRGFSDQSTPYKSVFEYSLKFVKIFKTDNDSWQDLWRAFLIFFDLALALYGTGYRCTFSALLSL